MKRQQAGFTLIELIVVILILGVLAATALPKFMNVTAQAHRAAVAGTAGALGSAVMLVKAQWVANGHTAAVDDLVNFGDTPSVDTNNLGYPTDTGGNNLISATPANCVNAWNGILQNPPVAAVASGAGVDYVATAAGEVCTFTYQINGAAASPARTFTYNAGTGAVAITANP